MSNEFIQDLEELYKGKPFLTIQEVAQFLECAEQVVYRWTRRPTRISVGKTLRFPRWVFLRWLANEQMMDGRLA